MKYERMLRYVLFTFLSCFALLCFQPMSGCSNPTGSESQKEATNTDAGDVEKSTSDGDVFEQGKEPVQDTSSTEKGSSTEVKVEQVQEPVQEPTVEITPEPKAEAPSNDAGTPEEIIVEKPVKETAVLEKVLEAAVEKAPPKTCAKDADCGKRTCLQAGKLCKRTTPICRQGLCVDLKVDIADTTCDTSTGVCRAPKPKCKDTCDCAQGLMCVKDASGEGTCIAGFVPVFCCENSGCPTGKVCVQRGGGKDVCP